MMSTTHATKGILQKGLPASMSLAALCMLALGTAATAQVVENDGVKLSASPDRPGAIYKTNEAVTFTIALSKDGAPMPGAAMRYTISKDGEPLRGHARKDARLQDDGKLAVAAGLDKPGFLTCVVEYLPESGQKLTLRSAAAVDPFAIKPDTPPPDDFDAFWDGQKKQLAAVPLNIHLTPAKTSAKGVELFEVRADTVEGGLMIGYLARPANAAAKSLPAIVLPHPAGMTAARPTVAVKWAMDGFLALDFNAHGLPNGQPAAFYAEQRKVLEPICGVTGLESRDTIYYRKMFLRLLRAIDTIAAQPEWNGKQLVVFGRSQGGGLALVAGGLDERVSFVSAELPAFCGITLVKNNRLNGWPHYSPGKTDMRAPAIQAAVRYYDCLNFAPRIKARVSLSAGFLDPTCPPTGIYAVYNQIASRKKIQGHPGIGHAGLPENEKLMRDEVLAWAGGKESP